MKQNTKTVITVVTVVTLVIVIGFAVHYHSENKRLNSELNQFKNFGNNSHRSPLSVVKRELSIIPNSLIESREFANKLKLKIENGGYSLFYSDNKLIGNERTLQIMFDFVSAGMKSIVNREVNNGRGPADFIVAQAPNDKTVIEIKLPTGGKKKVIHGLTTQTDIYKRVNNTTNSIRILAFFSEKQEKMIDAVMEELNLKNDLNVIVIDARNYNKQSASKALTA